MEKPASLTREISPPSKTRRAKIPVPQEQENPEDGAPPDAALSLAAIEAGEAKIRDHLAYFSEHLSRNNLIESASHATGSLLIWDTGEYSILQRQAKAVQTDDELSAGSDHVPGPSPSAQQRSKPENQKLFEAFQSTHIRLRLHGTRLPRNYTISLRLPPANNTTKAQAMPRKRRRKSTYIPSRVAHPTTDSDTTEEIESGAASPSRTHSRRSSATSSTLNGRDDDHQAVEVANASEAEDEDQQTRINNAYPGATNSIGSVHQRQWFLRLDQANSGFVRATSGPEKGRWVRSSLSRGRGGPGGDDTEREEKELGGFDTFFVRGAEHERSVVTGRLSKDVFADEGVEGFLGRKMWRPIME
ncbi:hypothetical protein H2201_006627 [Coniosporium apollinis]|uniref:DNA ligase D 3'-phosphoesterase domain-containing protein n=1 Tax=Coniosporium apollinis TaxID=61459 RepID=A0ABQ9NPP6_9PEZI|nr:hypothetical protein H2201_006627 [Coniosporium apollinis]